MRHSSLKAKLGQPVQDSSYVRQVIGYVQPLQRGSHLPAYLVTLFTALTGSNGEEESAQAAKFQPSSKSTGPKNSVPISDPTGPRTKPHQSRGTGVIPTAMKRNIPSKKLCESRCEISIVIWQQLWLCKRLYRSHCRHARLKPEWFVVNGTGDLCRLSCLDTATGTTSDVWAQTELHLLVLLFFPSGI
jgi:hypothetical protein